MDGDRNCRVISLLTEEWFSVVYVKPSEKAEGSDYETPTAGTDGNNSGGRATDATPAR